MKHTSRWVMHAGLAIQEIPLSRRRDGQSRRREYFGDKMTDQKQSLTSQHTFFVDTHRIRVSVVDGNPFINGTDFCAIFDVAADNFDEACAGMRHILSTKKPEARAFMEKLMPLVGQWMAQ